MLKIFNTLTGKKEIFKNMIKNVVSIYVCGVTVYDFCHIGHGRTFVIFDMIVRYLRHSNFIVKYVRNITDIDDKIIHKSINNKIDINILTNSMIQAMHQDFSSLGLLIPDAEPRVTECIQDIIDAIQKLINNQSAYINKDGNVLFSTDKDLRYGSLSGQSLCCLRSGLRNSINHIKHNSLDFFLWKKSKNDTYSWNSPWGRGRPGWHIECSTMIKMYFHNTLDIHGGGSDLLFPHHENELAQSIALNNKFKVNFWMHSGMVIIDNKKMSKSSGNSLFLKNILLYTDAETIRYCFLSTHYRHPMYYSPNNLKKSRLSLEHLYIALSDTNPIVNISEGQNFENEFYNAMNDDFNTPKAFSVLFQLSHKINYFKNKNLFKANKLAFRLRYLAGSLGFLLQKPQKFLQQRNFFSVKEIKNIEQLIEQRNFFRKKKLWKKSDKIRQDLFSLGIILEDFSTHTIWRKN